MTEAQIKAWYEENKLIQGQKVYESTIGFWVFVKQYGSTWGIASNDGIIRSYVRSHGLDSFVTREEAEAALERMAKQFVLTPVEPGS